MRRRTDRRLCLQVFRCESFGRTPGYLPGLGCLLTVSTLFFFYKYNFIQMIYTLTKLNPTTPQRV